MELEEDNGTCQRTLKVFMLPQTSEGTLEAPESSEVKLQELFDDGDLNGDARAVSKAGCLGSGLLLYSH